MFTFDNNTLVYLLEKLQVEIDKKIDKEQYISELVKSDSGALTVVADDVEPFDKATMIKLNDAQAILPDLVEGDKVDATYADKQLSVEVFTAEEKAVLAEILEAGSIDEIINEKLDGMKIDVISVADFEFAEAAGTLDPSILYIVSDESIKAIELDNYATQEQIEELEEAKQDKETYIGRVEADGLTVVADDIDPFDEATQIKVSDARIAGEGFVEGEIINLEKPMVLSEENFTEEDAALLDDLLAEGFDNMLFKKDVVDNLKSDVVDVPLSANQGKVLKEEFLDSMKHVYLTEAEYVALMEVVIDDAAGALTVVETVVDEATQIAINDDAIVWNNKALEEAGGILIALGNKVNFTDTREEDVVYHITDADELYGLTEEQMKHLQIAYEHTFIDLDSKYAAKKEVYDAKINKSGQSFTSLANRLFDVDELIDMLFYDMENVRDSVYAYGVKVNFEEQEFTRTLKAKKMVQSDFDSVYPWAGMRRCNIKDGVVMCYEGEEGYIEDGSNGDVMVEIPKFYYKVLPVKLEASAANSADQQIVEANWMISPRNLKSFKVHPAFVRNGVEIDHIYIGAFEACLYDTSTSAFVLDDAQVMDATADKLSSIINAKPASGATQALNLVNSRQLAQNKGDGYNLIDFTTVSAIQMLLLIECASFDSQSCIGQGIVNITDDGNNTNQALNTGSSEAVVYRGIENLWGNIWNWVDGINIDASSRHYAYWSNDNYVSAASTGYNKINFKLCCSNGYIDRFGYDEENDFAFLPTRATGSSAIAANDYYHQNNGYAGWIGYHLGGHWKYASQAGCWCSALNNAASINSYHFGARIAFHKTN